MTVAIENSFGVGIFHEARGHSLEATAVAKEIRYSVIIRYANSF